MAERIELPSMPQGRPEEQLQNLYSYLYRLAQTLNINLSSEITVALTDDEQILMNQLTAAIDSEKKQIVLQGYNWQEQETLKSLIIKTAEFVKTEADAYRLVLFGETAASSEFGNYIQKKGVKVDVTPDGVKQTYSFSEVVKGLKTFEVNAKNYIKTGYLRTQSGLPVYGVAIGKDVVTFSEDGTETYHDANKVAELTADELSFFQNGYKVASYTGNKISFLYNGADVFYIQNGKIYCAKDLEITSGNNLIINSSNFVVDPTNGVWMKGELETTSWKFSDDGARYKNGNYTMGIGDYESGSYAYTNGGLYFLVKQHLGVLGKYGHVRLIASDQSGSFQNYVALECFPVYNPQTYQYEPRGAFYQTGFVGNGSVSLGRRENTWFNAYIQNVYSIDSQHSIRVRMLDQSSSYQSQWVDLEEFIPFHFAYKHSTKEQMLFFVNNTYTTSAGQQLQVESYLGQGSAVWDQVYAGDVHYDNLIQNSSREVKRDIRKMESVGKQLDQLVPVEFRYKDDPEGRQRHGLIYEDTQPVMPEICVESDGQKTINYVELIPMLLKEIQDLRSRVAELEAKVNKEAR